MPHAAITIGGTDYTSYLISLERDATLEKPGTTVKLVFSPDFPHADVSPWDDLIIEELGTLTLTGFVSHIIPRRAPAQTEVQGMDTFKRARDWFIDEEYVTSGSSGFDVEHYIDYFCGLCGIDFSILDSAGAAFQINADIPMGLRSVSEALIQLCEIAQWTMRVDENGTLIFDHLPFPTASDFTLGDVESFEEEFNDIDTRNVAKIWGGPPVGIPDAGNVLYQESRYVIGVPDTRSMLFSAPAIDTLEKAQEMATAALDQWARVEHILSAQTIGDPEIYVGSAIDFTNSRLDSGAYLDTLTDLKSTLNTNTGYQQNLTMGRRAYRYPYWPVATSGSTVPTSGSTAWITSGSFGYVQRIVESEGYLYLIGNNTTAGSNTKWRVEKYDATSGSQLWSRTIDQGIVAVGIDIVADGDIYATQMSFSVFLSSWFSTIWRLDASNGATIAITSSFDESSDRPWITQDEDYLYKIEGQFSASGIRKLSKPGLVTQWLSGGQYTAIGNNTNYVIGSAFGTESLNKIDKATGVILESFHHGYGNSILEISTQGNQTYALINTSGSQSTWQVARFSTGALPHDPIGQDWIVSGPNNFVYLGGNIPAERAILAAPPLTSLSSYVLVGMSYLYSAFFVKLDGGFGNTIGTLSPNGNDVITSLAVSGRNVYAAGRKNNNWYIANIRFP